MCTRPRIRDTDTCKVVGEDIAKWPSIYGATDQFKTTCPGRWNLCREIVCRVIADLIQSPTRNIWENCCSLKKKMDRVKRKRKKTGGEKVAVYVCDLDSLKKSN